MGAEGALDVRWLVLAVLLLFHREARADVLDPSTALKTLYRPYDVPATDGKSAGIEKVWQLAGPQLRRRLVANGVCTIPLRQRAFRCTSPFDPVVNGRGGRTRLISLEPLKSECPVRRFEANLDTNGVMHKVHFFVLSFGREWAASLLFGRRRGHGGERDVLALDGTHIALVAVTLMRCDRSARPARSRLPRL